MNRTILFALFFLLFNPRLPFCAAQPGREDGRPGRSSGEHDRGSRGRSSFLERLDRNGDGILSPDEQVGPASFLIQRVQSFDSSIVSGRPIPIEKMKAAFEKMRGDRNSDQGRGSSDRESRWRGRSEDRASDKSLETQLLVPGFGSDSATELLMSFGSAAELMTASVTEPDRREAQRRMRQFDKDQDGFLTKGELTSQFSGNPMDFDRNSDGRLSADELAVRYARRREGKEQAAATNRERGASHGGRRGDPYGSEPAEAPDLFNGRKSYRSLGSRSVPEGAPGFFTERDLNHDGQVSMAEFTDQWNDDELKRFFESDFNQDGVITADEAIRSVEEGPAKHGSGGVIVAPQNRSPDPRFSKPVDPKYIKVSERIISRYDKNKDGALTVSEWKRMLMSPLAADANKDGRITPEEYARWIHSRESSR